MLYSESFNKALAELDTAKKNAISQFQMELNALAGTRLETHKETNALVKQILETRRSLAAAFLHEKQRVILQFSNGSFQLKSTDRKRKHVASSREFPHLEVVDASTLKKE